MNESAEKYEQLVCEEDALNFKISLINKQLHINYISSSARRVDSGFGWDNFQAWKD